LKRLLTLLCAAAGALGIHACDYVAMKDLKPGVSTGYDVRDKLGTPTFEWRNEDGSLTWEFARTPMGKENYMAEIGSDNVLRELRQVISEGNFARVRKGMSRDEIRHLLGKPASIAPVPLKRQEAWEWRYANVFNADMRFNVYFDLTTGTVVRSESREEPKA
jgi:hypothetical protein